MLILLSSCSMLPKTETLEIYRLPAASTAPSIPAAILPWTLRISTPNSSQIIDSARVLVLRHDNQVSAYKGVRWIDPAPILLRDRLVSAFRVDGRLRSVSNDNTNLPSDLELGGDLSAFQVEYSDSITAVNIRFYAILAQSARNRTIAARSFEVRQPVTGKGMPEVIAAFGQAVDTLASELTDWTLQQGSAIEPAAK